MGNAITGKPRSFYRRFKFTVDIEGFGSLAFQKCSPITVEQKQTEHWEGGAVIPFKAPSGRMEFADITLDRGATNDFDAYNWMLQVGDALAQRGEVDITYKRNAAVVQLDRDGAELTRYNLFGCWPKNFTAGEWDNTSDDVVIEMMVLAYDFFVRVGSGGGLQVGGGGGIQVGG